MLKTILVALLPILIVIGSGWDRSFTGPTQQGRQENTGTLEKMIVASGTVAMDLDMSRLGGAGAGKSRSSILRFNTEPDAFFTVIVFNNELRGALPSSMKLIPQESLALPAKLSESYEHLIVENMPVGSPYELTVRDGR